MKGTEKQVKWAEDIIKQSIVKLSAECKKRASELKAECIDEEQLEKDLYRNEYIMTAYPEAINKIAEDVDAAKIINAKSVLTGIELRRELVKAVRIKKNGKIASKIEAKLGGIIK